MSDNFRAIVDSSIVTGMLIVMSFAVRLIAREIYPEHIEPIMTVTVAMFSIGGFVVIFFGFFKPGMILHRKEMQEIRRRRQSC